MRKNVEGERAALKVPTSTREALGKEDGGVGRNVLKMKEEDKTWEGSKHSIAQQI